jgi:uncharacterized protein (DUF1499 family)
LTSSSVFSRSALLLALLAAIAAMLAGLGTRAGWWHFRTGFQILTWAAYGGIGSAVIASIACILALWRGPRSAPVAAVLGLALSLVVVAIPWNMKRSAQRVPAIHDISTDTEDPPRFVSVLPLRKDVSNSADYGGPEVAIQQHRAYPDIQPLVSDMPMPEAFAKALKAAEAMGWEIVAVNQAEGRIEATDTTFWFGFKDDIVVRVQSQGDGSRIDVRSVSRVGKSDVGMNAQRIRLYVRKLQRAT